MAKLFQELKLHNKSFEVRVPRHGSGLQPLRNRQPSRIICGNLSIPARRLSLISLAPCSTPKNRPVISAARMRRGYLYNFAKQLGCNKIAPRAPLYDDVIETILMGMLWGAQVQTMMPKIYSTNFPRHGTHPSDVPLHPEDDIKAWRDANDSVFHPVCLLLHRHLYHLPPERRGKTRQQTKQLIQGTQEDESRGRGAWSSGAWKTSVFDTVIASQNRRPENFVWGE